MPRQAQAQQSHGAGTVPALKGIRRGGGGFLSPLVMIGTVMGPTGIVTSTFSGSTRQHGGQDEPASSRLIDGRISCRIIDFTVDAGEPKES